MALVTKTLDCGCVVTITRGPDWWRLDGYEQCADHKASQVRLTVRYGGGNLEIEVEEAPKNCTRIEYRRPPTVTAELNNCLIHGAVSKSHRCPEFDGVLRDAWTGERIPDGRDGPFQGVIDVKYLGMTENGTQYTSDQREILRKAGMSRFPVNDPIIPPSNIRPGYFYCQGCQRVVRMRHSCPGPRRRG